MPAQALNNDIEEVLTPIISFAGSRSSQYRQQVRYPQCAHTVQPLFYVTNQHSTTSASLCQAVASRLESTDSFQDSRSMVSMTEQHRLSPRPPLSPKGQNAGTRITAFAPKGFMPVRQNILRTASEESRSVQKCDIQHMHALQVCSVCAQHCLLVCMQSECPAAFWKHDVLSCARFTILCRLCI